VTGQDAPKAVEKQGAGLRQEDVEFKASLGYTVGPGQPELCSETLSQIRKKGREGRGRRKEGRKPIC
jgi:hypothetical protein